MVLYLSNAISFERILYDKVERQVNLENQGLLFTHPWLRKAKKREPARKASENEAILLGNL